MLHVFVKYLWFWNTFLIIYPFAFSAYHGHLTSMIDISPYKFNQPKGTGKKDWVHVVNKIQTLISLNKQIKICYFLVFICILQLFAIKFVHLIIIDGDRVLILEIHNWDSIEIYFSLCRHLARTHIVANIVTWTIQVKILVWSMRMTWEKFARKWEGKDEGFQLLLQRALCQLVGRFCLQKITLEMFTGNLVQAF